MKYLAAINAQCYYGTDSHYGKIVFVKACNTPEEAKSVIEETLKKWKVEEEQFTDSITGWKDNELRYVYVEDYDEVKISDTENTCAFAASILEFDETKGDFLLLAHSCFDGPATPIIEAQGCIMQCRIHSDLYIKKMREEMDSYRDLDEAQSDSPILEADQYDKAWELGYAWVKNPTGINLIDGCEGVALSSSIVDWKEGKVFN